MNKQDISVHDKSVFVGIWNYIKPDMKPDRDGNVMLVQMQNFFRDCGLEGYVEVYRKAEQFVREQKTI